MAVEQVDVEKENEKEPGKGWKTRGKSSGGRERDREQRGNVNSVDESGRTRLHTSRPLGTCNQRGVRIYTMLAFNLTSTRLREDFSVRRHREARGTPRQSK